MESQGPVSLPPLMSHIPLPCRGIRSRKKYLNPRKKSVWPVSKEHNGWKCEERGESSSRVCLFGLSAIHQVTWLKIIRHWLCGDECFAAIGYYKEDLILPSFESSLTREAQVLDSTHFKINSWWVYWAAQPVFWLCDHLKVMVIRELVALLKQPDQKNTNCTFICTCVCVCVSLSLSFYPSIRHSQTW